MSSLEQIADERETKLRAYIMRLGKCPDNFVGTLSLGSKNFNLKTAHLNFTKADRQTNCCAIQQKATDKKRLVIVLESPHKDEFNEDFTAPALGATGNNLEKYFLEILHEYFNNNPTPGEGNYEIILMNALQYQCSAGLCTKLYRDFFWLKFWFEEELKKDFICRLNEYKPDIIINLCTKGCHDCDPNLNGNPKAINKKYLKNRIGLCLNDYSELECITSTVTLQSLVSTSIILSFPNIPIVNGTHPSSWNRKGSFRAFKTRKNSAKS